MTTAPDRRQQAILDLLRDEGRVDVTAAAEQLEVAPETVRRDLAVLERAGRLVRVHGGAVPTAAPSRLRPGSTGGDVTLAAAAWAELPRDGTLLIGAGAHCLSLAEAIVVEPPGSPGLQVITHSLDVAVTLSRVSQLSVYNVGGIVSPEGHAQVGDWALTELRRFHVDVAVLAPVGVTPTALTAATPATAAVAQAAVAAAGRLLVLADRTSAGHHGHVEFAPTSAAELVLLSEPADMALVAAIREAGPRVNLID